MLEQPTKAELERLSFGFGETFEADKETADTAMHSLEENVLKRAEKSRKQKSEEEEDDNEEEDDDEEEKDDEKIEFDELEDPDENSDATSTSPKRERSSERRFENLETTTERKIKDVETSRGSNEDSMKGKVKVKKRNIMFRAEKNEFPEFDSEEGGEDKRMSSETEKKQKESNIQENVDENKNLEMKDNEISEDDVIDNRELEEIKKKKKKMRRIRVKMNRSDENEEEEEEKEGLKDSNVQKKKKKNCKNRQSENSVESKSENGQEQISESKSKKCGGGRGGGGGSGGGRGGGGASKKKKKKHQQSRYRNVKETKKRAFVKNLRVIGRQFNVRPSSSGFYGKDRDWSDRPTGRNISESPIEVFNSAWPKLKKHLFNVRLDPEERNDLALSRPDVMEQLREKVVELLKTFVSRDYPAPSNKGRPNHFNNVWSPGWC